MDSGWRRWLYQKWNERLIEYCFLDTEGLEGTPIERIPATPEELREVVKDSSAEPEEVVAAFVASVKRKVPSGVSFEGFCSNRMTWSPVSENPPRFFAMLWLTCLVAYGYPEGISGFHARMKTVLGSSQQMGCLPEIWSDMEEWTQTQASNIVGFRPLKLPPYDHYRSNIGHSWFLAFPHHHDRRKLREILEHEDLVGDEPPVAPMVSVLERNRNVFGSFFREDLDVFVKTFLHADANVRDSPFWRAVRQEALAPTGEGTAESRRASENTALMAALEDDELYVYVACSNEAQLPSGYLASDIDDVIDGFSHFVVADVDGNTENDGTDMAALAVLEGRLIVPRARVHAPRGVLVFQEVGIFEYRLAGGADANQAEVALVRNDKVAAFRQAYGGRARPSRLPGWQQILECKVLVCPDAPPGLRGVKHLQETMIPPSVRLAEGIRTEEGYYAFPGFLPVVRFDDAKRVQIVDAQGVVVGEASRSVSNRDEWHLPDELAQQAPGEWIIRVYWTDNVGHARTSKKTLVFVDRQASHDYKRLRRSGRYYIEACEPGEAEIVGSEEISLGITAADSADAADQPSFESITSVNGSGYWTGVEPDYRVGHFADALAALSVKRSGVPQNLFFDLFSAVLGIKVYENPVLFYDLLRGWVEAGAIDVALSQGSRASYISARRPSFVAFWSDRRIQASLLGLVPSTLQDRVQQAVAAEGASCTFLLPPCEWLPQVIRVECDTSSVLEELSTDLNLAPPRWLRWPDTSPTKTILNIQPDQQELREGPASDSFVTESRWDWYQGRFVKETRSSRGIRVQRRTHPEHASAYVVVVDGEDWFWSYVRNWSLLLAYFLDADLLGEDDPIFTAREQGPIVRPKEADVYLPLPIGRLCAVLGDGLSGPVLSNDSATVKGYQYPLGLGYREALAEWIAGTGCVGFDGGKGY